MPAVNGKQSLPTSNGKSSSKLNLRGLWHIFTVFGRHYKKYAKILAIAFVFMLLTIGVGALTPWPLKLILDYVILQQPLPEEAGFLNAWFVDHPKKLLFVLAFSILLLTIVDAIFSYISKFWMSSTGERINADIRERVFAHLGRLSLSFHDSSRTGNLIYLLTSDVKQMKDILIDMPQELVTRVLTILIYSGLLLWLDWRVGLLALATLPVVYWVSKVYGFDLRSTVVQRRTREGAIASFISENVNAMAVVQAYGREESVRERFHEENNASLRATLEGLRIRRTYGRFTDFFMLLGTCTILYAGGRFAMTREILPGTLLVMLAYVK
ncbi:MAG: ABC transporter ATP-binding protein, partial [candidate division KSB1 bacterium]